MGRLQRAFSVLWGPGLWRVWEVTEGFRQKRDPASQARTPGPAVGNASFRGAVSHSLDLPGHRLWGLPSRVTRDIWSQGMHLRTILGTRTQSLRDQRLWVGPAYPGAAGVRNSLTFDLSLNHSPGQQ